VIPLGPMPSGTLRLMGFATLAALLFTGVLVIYMAGEEAELQRAELAQLKADLNTQRQINAATSAVLSARVESKARIQTITKEIIREVPTRIPADACSLPDEWRLLHDAAAEGKAPAPAGSADAAPTAPQEAADTVVENYGQYHDVADQLRKLQQWAHEVSR
jgi:hypothetical protein